LSNCCSFLKRNGCPVARARQVLACPMRRTTSRTRSWLLNAPAQSRAGHPRCVFLVCLLGAHQIFRIPLPRASSHLSPPLRLVQMDYWVWSQ
jgi:hypothetical protein